MKTENNLTSLKSLYPKYFKLTIHQRINERQERNALNINYLFSTVLRSGDYSNYTAEYPRINNGIYHKYGKTHSKYPKSK